MFKSKEVETLKEKIKELEERLEKIEIQLTPKQYFGGN